jgi:hypothetical protein
MARFVWFAALALVSLALVGCSPPELRVDEAEALLIKETVAGIDIGDSWDEIQKHLDPRFTVNRKRLGITYPEDGKVLDRWLDLDHSPPDNGYAVSVHLSAQRTVDSIYLEVRGSEKNQDRAAEIAAALIDHFDSTLSAGRCTSYRCTWQLKVDGASYAVVLKRVKLDKPPVLIVKVEVFEGSPAD